MDNMLEIIGKHEVFAGLNKDELASLENIVHRRIAEEGEIIFSITQAPKFLYYIESGSFTLHLSSNENKTLKSGQLFGEVGIINDDFRSGSVTAAEKSTIIGICGTRIFNKDFVPPAVALKVVRALAKKISNYLRSKEQISTREIIEHGENEFVEFKSTLRWNLFSLKKDRAIENASLKTLAAFMNSDGGILIVGVADDGKILGLKNDNFANHDKLLMHLTSLIKERIGSLFLKYLHFSIEVVEQEEVLRINCQPSNQPVYLNDGQAEHFYIRTGPSTTDLRLSKLYDFIKDRFEK